MKKTLFALVAVLGIFLLSGSAVDAAAATTTPKKAVAQPAKVVTPAFTRIKTIKEMNLEMPRKFLVIQDDATWQNFILNVGPNTPSVPKINFAKDRVVAVVKGAGGVFPIEVTGVREERDRIVVAVREESQEPASAEEVCVSPAVIRNPAVILQIKKSAKPIVFRLTRTITDCGIRNPDTEI